MVTRKRGTAERMEKNGRARTREYKTGNLQCVRVAREIFTSGPVQTEPEDCVTRDFRSRELGWTEASYRVER